MQQQARLGGMRRKGGRGVQEGGSGPPPRQSKVLLTHCFGYTVGLTFQSPKIKLATRRQIFKLKYTKFVVGWTLTQSPLGELTALTQTP